jgi:hypothetical protein
MLAQRAYLHYTWLKNAEFAAGQHTAYGQRTFAVVGPSSKRVCCTHHTQQEEIQITEPKWK